MIGWLVATILVVGGAASYMAWRWFNLKAQYARTYHAVPGFDGVVAHVPNGVSIDLVSQKLDKASQLLIKYGPWTGAQVTTAAHRCTIHVMDTDAWVDSYGRKVAGEEIGGTLQVGRNLAALCHELAHWCETLYDGLPDDAHATWAKRGVQRAVDEFEA